MPSINYPLVRTQITMQQVLDLVHFKASRHVGHELRGPCPLHGATSEKSKSFAVNPHRNAFRCFSCGAQGNQLDLWAAFRKLPLYEATLDLCQRLDAAVPLLTRDTAPKPAKPDHRVNRQLRSENLFREGP